MVKISEIIEAKSANIHAKLSRDNNDHLSQDPYRRNQGESHRQPAARTLHEPHLRQRSGPHQRRALWHDPR